MSRKEKSRIDTSGGNGLDLNPFGALGALANLPTAAPAASADVRGRQAQQTAEGANGTGGEAGHTAPAAATGAKRFSGRIDIRREKSGRGGKVVTTLSGEGLAALPEAERDALLKQLKNRFGCGGSRDGALLEVQGNLVEQLTPVLSGIGWRVVRTGG